MAADRVRHRFGEAVAIDRQRRAGRHAAPVGRAQHQRAEAPHFFFQQSDGVIELVATERVGADQFGETVGFVDRGRPDRPHFVQHHRHAGRSSLPGGFGAGQTAADDCYRHLDLNTTINAEAAEPAEYFRPFAFAIAVIDCRIFSLS